MLTLAEQQRIVLPRLDRSLTQVAAIALSDRASILELAAQRLECGYVDYGDSMFLAAHLRLDIHEELADAAVYAAVAAHRGDDFEHDLCSPRAKCPECRARSVER